MLYGRELYGMSSSRASIIRNRVWRAFKFIFRHRNVAYDSVSDEFGIERIEIQACKSRIRAVKKYVHSKIIISEVLGCTSASRKTTWSSRSLRWVKRYMHLDPQQFFRMDGKRLFEIAKEVYISRKSHFRSAGSKFRKDLNLIKLNFPSLLGKVKQSDLFKFVLLRVGRVPGRMS